MGKDDPQCNLELPNNLDFAGWVADATSYIEAAELVVTAAGHNSVMEVGRARKRFIAIAEPRPFDKQLRNVYVFNREQLAVGLSCWPSGNKWSKVIDDALELDPSRWDSVFQPDGAKQAASHLQGRANQSRDIRSNGKLVCL